MTFRIKVNTNPFEAKGPFLCCTLNKGAECTFCGMIMCKECARAWSQRRHFVLDMCRSRFSKKELEEANKCYKDRLKEGNGTLKRPGDCKVCRERLDIGNDRNFYDEEDDF